MRESILPKNWKAPGFELLKMSVFGPNADLLHLPRDRFRMGIWSQISGTCRQWYATENLRTVSVNPLETKQLLSAVVQSCPFSCPIYPHRKNKCMQMKLQRRLFTDVLMECSRWEKKKFMCNYKSFHWLVPIRDVWVIKSALLQWNVCLAEISPTSCKLRSPRWAIYVSVTLV